MKELVSILYVYIIIPITVIIKLYRSEIKYPNSVMVWLSIMFKLQDNTAGMP